MKTTTRLLSLAFIAACAAVAASADDLKSPFQSLPTETVAAFRLDNTPEVRQQYVEKTKIGQLLFSEEKIAEYKTFVDSLVEENEKAAEFVNGLNAVGLELDDLYAMLSSHLGAAIVLQNVEGRQQMPTLLVWAEMDESTASRAYQALLDSSAEKETVERTDQELAGTSVSRIRNKGTGSSFLVSKLQNRFLFAIGFPQDLAPTPDQPDLMRELAVAYEEAELEALGFFIQSQKADGGGFLSSFYGDSGISSVRPEHEVRLVLLGDLQKLMQFAAPKTQQTINLLELNQFTKLGLWSGLVGMEERSLIFLGAPAPREGVAKLIENEPYNFQPPAWVPAAVNTYSSFSFDVSSLYEVGLQIARKAVPPEVVDQQLAMLNQQLQTMLQTDVETFLNSFGQRFHALEYPIEIKSVDFMGSSTDLPQEQQAIVVDFTNPQILDAGLAMLGGMASNPDSGMSIIEEQGFKGVRAPTPEGDVVIAHGLGKLVIAVGGETMANRIFSALNNPPEGDNALLNDPQFRRFMQEYSPKPGSAFSYAQGDKVLKNLVPLFKVIGDAMRSSAEEGEDEESNGSLIEELVELLPTEEELEGSLGVVFTRMYFNDAGLVVEGTNEYK